MKIVREKCGEEFGEKNCGEERATLVAMAADFGDRMCSCA
jgi:hypothetical protein